MEYYQENLIIKLLEKYPMEIEENTPDIDYDIQNLLRNFTNGYNIYFLSQIIHKFLGNKSTSRMNGIHNISTIFPNSIGKLYVDTDKSSIYIIDITKNTYVIIKSSKVKSRLSSIIREYFIGIKAINKLRYYIPTFVYTLGAFKQAVNDKKEYFIMYEKIPGKTLTEFLVGDNISFNDWLIIFVQILISLEVAQKEIGFTHFDLHTSNIMIRKDIEVNYKVNLNTKSYTIQNTVLLPVIIDFGLSSVLIDDNFIGSYDLPQYGMLNFIVPGYDMYKLLCFSVLHAKSIREDILGMFDFFGSTPFGSTPFGSGELKNNLRIENPDDINNYCKGVTFSEIGNITPLLFLNWIFQKYDLTHNISEQNRDNYFIFETTDLTINKSIVENKILDYMGNNQSYIMLKYFENLCIRFNIPFNSKYHKNSNYLIKIDNCILDKVFNIQLPSDNIDNLIKNVLTINLRHNNAEDKKKKVVKFLESILYESELQPYLQFYYTILELNLREFDDWVKRFVESDVYSFYFRYTDKISRTLRWCNALLASIII